MNHTIHVPKPQILVTETGEELVVLGRRHYDALLARLGDEAAEDRMSARLLDEAQGRPALPAWLAEAMMAGTSPMRAARKRANLTQNEAAAKAGIGQAFYSDLESGKKYGTLETRIAIAKALSVEPEWLDEQD